MDGTRMNKFAGALIVKQKRPIPGTPSWVSSGEERKSDAEAMIYRHSTAFPLVASCVARISCEKSIHKTRSSAAILIH